MNIKLKNLTGKNPKDFEPAAYALINNSDTELFSELVSQDDFLFDFVKQNVASRLANVCNETNYLNILNFLKYYSPSYEEFMVSTLVQYADEDLTDKMLEIFENGTDEEKTYCAKFFSYIQDPLALDLLKKYAYSENSYLASNCASTLAALNDSDSYNKALEMLKSDDEFTKLDGVKFLVSYGNPQAATEIINAMKTSSMAENIAGELLYLTDLYTLNSKNPKDFLFVLNTIINGLGEILQPGVVFDYQLYNVFEELINKPLSSDIAVVLYNAQDRFNTLTENDEYLFDETKDTKQEVNDIKKLLNKLNSTQLVKLLDNELQSESSFVFTALEFTQNTQKVRNLLSSSLPAVIVKSLEVLKRLDNLTTEDKQLALNSINDENLKNIIMAI